MSGGGTTSFGFCFRPSTRKNSADGREEPLGRIYIRVVHGGESRSVTTDYRIAPDEWDPARRRLAIPYARTERSRQLFEIERNMMADMRRLDFVVRQLRAVGPYSADTLIARFRELTTGNSLVAFTTRLAAQKELSGAGRTAEAYRTSLARFLNFAGLPDMALERMSASMIREFENTLTAEGCSPNTVSFYMRTLRAIYRKAVAENRVPAGSDNIFAVVWTGPSDPSARSNASLTPIELAVLGSLDPTLDEASQRAAAPFNKIQKIPDHLSQALAMFLFCYHAQGMSFADMALLKKSDLREDIICYGWAKTGRQTVVRIVPVMRRIIDWFAPSVANSEYLFPVIPGEGEGPGQGSGTRSNSSVRRQYESALRLQNQRLKKLATLCGIASPMSTNTARHPSIGPR